MLNYLIVIPTYNEVDNLERIYYRIRKVSQADLLFIDDGSYDGTDKKIEKLRLIDSKIEVMYRQEKLGLGSAYRDSYSFAISNNYDYLIQCDADGSHEIEKIPEMLETSMSGNDLVIGSRYVEGGSVKGWSKSRLVISKLGNYYSQIVLGLRTKDNTAGFRVYKVESLKKTDFNRAKANGYAFQVQMTYLFRSKNTVEVPISFVERQYGKSKMTACIAFEAIVQIPLLRFR